MHDSKIEWVLNPDNKTLGKIWNPLTGCLNGCEYCYARKLANTRLKSTYLANKNIAPSFMNIHHILDAEHRQDSGYADPFYPRFWEDRLEGPFEVRGNAGIFACDMSDLFGIGIPEKWTTAVMNVIEIAQQHRFYLLTKQPQNLAKFSPFPDNAWVGVSATNHLQAIKGMKGLRDIQATIKFMSFEPLLADIGFNDTRWGKANQIIKSLDWVIIGAQTKPTVMPKIEWVREIVGAADKAGIPVFLKENLSDIIPVNSNLHYGPAGELRLRQEMPR